MNYSIDEFIDHASTLIVNAVTHPQVNTRIKEYGYHAQRMEEGRVLLEQLNNLQMKQEDCYSNGKELKKQLDKDLEAIKQLYLAHLEIARFAFRHDTLQQVRLELQGSRKRGQSKMTHQIRKFYIRLEPVMRQMKQHGAKPEEVAQAKAMIDAIAAVRAERKQCQGNAQAATQARNQAKKDLQKWLADFKKVARIALKEEQQLLEVFGITVPSNR